MTEFVIIWAAMVISSEIRDASLRDHSSSPMVTHFVLLVFAAIIYGVIAGVMWVAS